MKKTLLSIFLVLFVFVFISTVNAQGTYDCSSGSSCSIINRNCNDFAETPVNACLPGSGGTNCGSTNNPCCLSLNTTCGGGLPGNCCDGLTCNNGVCEIDSSACNSTNIGSCSVCEGTNEVCTSLGCQVLCGSCGATCDPLPSACESDHNGDCRTIAHLSQGCPDGFNPNPVGGYGELGCSQSQVCCTPLTTGCYSRNPIANCDPGDTRCSGAPTICCIDSNFCPVYDPGWINASPQTCNTTNPDGSTGTGIDTAIGCIPVENTQELTKFLLSWGLGITGGIAFLLIVYAGFLVTTSQGNPQRLQAGKELLTAALSGLMLVIFSVTILRLIGVEILGLPGFQ